jgi:hypothetical protein
MAIGSKVSGDFKSASGLFAKVNGGWKKAQFGYIKVAGEWKQFWADKLEDAFDRTDTTNTLGTATSGQAWTLLRSQWQINSNAARTTGAKTDYPLANIDLGFLDFNIEANELTPGTGVAIRVEDANNWWGVVPFYNQTSQSYSYCVASRTVSYCIAACTEPAGNTLRCDAPNTLIVEDVYDFVCPGGEQYIETCDWVISGQDCAPDTVVPGACYNERYETCEWVYVPFSSPRRVCTQRSVRVCDPATVVPGECTDNYDYICYDYVDCPGGYSYEVIGQSQECSPDGFTNVPYYACCQAGTYQECTQTATGITYTNYYYLQVVKMVNGVFSVVADVQVPERWSAVKMSANATTLTVNAYTDSLYTNQIGTYTTNAFTATGSGYGVVARPSNFEDGRTIGSLKVLPLGQ